jgi:hypothetical protein
VAIIVLATADHSSTMNMIGNAVTWTERNLIDDNGTKLLSPYDPVQYPHINCLAPTRMEGCFVVEVQDTGAGLSEVMGCSMHRMMMLLEEESFLLMMMIVVVDIYLIR